MLKHTPLISTFLRLNWQFNEKETAVLQTAKFDNSTPTSKHRLLSRRGLVVKQLKKNSAPPLPAEKTQDLREKSLAAISSGEGIKIKSPYSTQTGLSGSLGTSPIVWRQYMAAFALAFFLSFTATLPMYSVPFTFT